MLHAYRKICIAFLAIFLFATTGSAQFNLNKYNGLPTDHVYMFLKDRYGYLWIATHKGVVRYNGYSFKTFNTSQELGSNDVWRIYRDRKDRIWLFSFSKSFGYIYHDKYHKVIENEEVINPGGQITESEAGLFFPTMKTVIDNAIADSGYVLYRETYPEGYHPESRFPVYATEMQEERVSLFSLNAGKYTKIKDCICPKGILPRNEYNFRMSRYRNHLFLYIRKKDTLVHLDIDSCRFKLMNTGQEGFSYIQGPENRDTDPRDYVYLYYRDRIDKLDSSLRLMQTFPVSSITGPGVSGYDLVYIFEDSMWGKCVATESNGAFITPAAGNPFLKYTSWDATGYSLINMWGDSIAYWWNERTHTLAKISHDLPPVIRKYNEVGMINKILPHDQEYDNLLMYHSYFLMSKKTGKLSRWRTVYNDSVGATKDHRLHKEYVMYNRDLHVFAFRKDAIFMKKILNGRFREVLKDPFRKGHWAYNHHNLYFINSNDSCILVNSLLKKLEIVQLDKFLADEHGNLLFLTGDRLIRYNPFSRKSTSLLPHCNLSDARIVLQKNTLVAAARFGVAFIHITPDGTYLPPLIYHNIKNDHYLFVTEILILKDNLLLHTDAGTYSIALPGKEPAVYSNLAHNLIIQYNDSIYSGTRIRINISQHHKVLLLDLIRPSGNGTLKFLYRIEDVDVKWKELNANELVLPGLEANGSYTLSLIARDDVWQSEVMKVRLYIEPLWWQSYPGLYLIWLAAIVVAGGALFFTVITTRRMIEKRIHRQKQMLELELKAIYAQINPHFIFNTLNSGLHFIRKQKTHEAYNHILRFSQLLRAYLKASRNRYITLAEEITNLKHYIELQQTRYDHLFDYDIRLDHIPKPEIIGIPSLLLQPIVENAIEHGLLPNEKHGHLEISFSLDMSNKQLTCLIKDDGIGRTRSRATRKKGSLKKESYGNNLVGELVTLFNKYEKMGIDIAYHDLKEPGTGTIVKITIRNPHLSYE